MNKKNKRNNIRTQQVKTEHTTFIYHFYNALFPVYTRHSSGNSTRIPISNSPTNVFGGL